MEKANLTIKPVNKSTWKDFEKLFESKGAPKYCWCMAWRMDADELKMNTSENRKAFIKKRIDSKVPVGLLAYDREEPVAWCSIAPRDSYRRLGGDDTLQDVWSLACFYIKKEYRRQGMVEWLIQQAKKYARELGAKFLEAYPVLKDSPSYRFMGFVPTFEKAGFSFVKMEGSRRHLMTCKI